MKNKKVYYREEQNWTSGEYGRWLLIALLVLAFPVGLAIMWQEAKWRKWVKCLVSAAWAAVIVCAVVLFFKTSLDYDVGSVSITAVKDDKRILAPLKPESMPDNEYSQLLINAQETSSLISKPTPTPVPTYVYCNDNGLYYHYKSCRYVYEGKTPRVTLNQALNAGKKPCKLCNPPKEETYGN